MLEFKGEVKVSIFFNGNESTNIYFDEELSFSRASKLWIKNEKDGVSDLYEDLKHNRNLDLEEGKTTFYKFFAEGIDTKPSVLWFISSVNEENGSILFDTYDI